MFVEFIIIFLSEVAGMAAAFPWPPAPFDAFKASSGLHPNMMLEDMTDEQLRQYGMYRAIHNCPADPCLQKEQDRREALAHPQEHARNLAVLHTFVNNAHMNRPYA